MDIGANFVILIELNFPLFWGLSIMKFLSDFSEENMVFVIN